MADLLHRASRDLAPDVPSLVAVGLRRGQARRRRRQSAAAVVASAVAVLLVVAGFELADSSRAGTRGVAPANPSPRSASAESADPGPVRPVDLAVTTDQVPTTFAPLEPGTVSAPGPKSGPDAAPVVDFTWNGFGVRVGLTPDDYVTGHRVRDPGRRCAEQEGAARCRPGPEGTVLARSSATNPAVDGGTRFRAVTVFRPDGWDVLVMAYNGPGKDGPATAAEPPFDLSQLQRIASSDTWFR